jgi:uncharacterized protein (TIGR03086 family)
LGATIRNMPADAADPRIGRFPIWSKGLRVGAFLLGAAVVVAAIMAAANANFRGIPAVTLFLFGLACSLVALTGVKAAVDRLKSALGWLGSAFGFLLLAFIIVSLPGAGLSWSSEHLPRSLHAAVLAVTGLLLIWGLYWISTEDLRKRIFPKISEWFGELAGPVIFSALLFLTAAETLASFTFILHDNELLELESNLAGQAVTEGRLLDFYLWHFLDVVPFLAIPEVTNLREPITYSGTWVGLLVLLFQGIGVLILIPTIRSFVQYRREHQQMDVISMYKRAVEQTGSIVERLRSEQLNNPTPCEQWNTRALLNHIIAFNQIWATPADAEKADDSHETMDFVGDNPVVAYRRSSGAGLKRLRGDRLAGPTHRIPSWGQVPGPFAPYIALVEITVHGWDLAKATEQDAEIDDDTARTVLNIAKRIVSPEQRRPPTSAFKDPVTVPDGATPTDELVAFLGRDPSWKGPR